MSDVDIRSTAAWLPSGASRLWVSVLCADSTAPPIEADAISPNMAMDIAFDDMFFLTFSPLQECQPEKAEYYVIPPREPKL